MTNLSHGSIPAIPPIVLLVDDDKDTVDMYSAFLEGHGLWVASATTPDEAVEAADELHPNVVVTDLSFNGRPAGTAILDTLHDNPSTAAIPVILLTGRAAEEIPEETRREAALVLTKPVLPDTLLERLEQVLAHSARLRARSSRVRGETKRLVEKSGRLLDRSERLKDVLEPGGRPCPACGSRLEWLERGSVQGVEYDYYRWCANGCGLYCYERGGQGRKWIKLA
jgi:CheY-like chemotaxis protein